MSCVLGKIFIDPYMHFTTDPAGVLSASFNGVQCVSSALGQSTSCTLFSHSVEGGGGAMEGKLSGMYYSILTEMYVYITDDPYLKRCNG